MILALAGCAAYQHYEASRPAAAIAMETALTQAGFTQMEADYPDQLEIVQGLPSYSLHSYPSPDGAVYWYYDPGTCGCVMVGNEKAFDNYQWQLTQRDEIAAYVTDSEDDDVASLNALNGSMFPPSLFLLGMAPAGRGSIGPRGGGGGVHGVGHDHGGGGHHEGGGGGHSGGGEGGGSGHSGGGGGGHGGGGHGR